MADRWFRVPTSTITDDGRDYDGPKYRDTAGVTGFSGNTIGNSPQWVVRFYGDSTTLDDIAAKSDSTELTASEAAEKFTNATADHLNGQWDATSVNQSFRVKL